MRFFRRGSSAQPSESRPDEIEQPAELDDGTSGKAPDEPVALPPTDPEGPEAGEHEAAEHKTVEGGEPEVVAAMPMADVVASESAEATLVAEPAASEVSWPPEPAPPPDAAPEAAPVEWAWGADWSPEKADAARREREQAQLEQGLERTRAGFGSRLRSALGVGPAVDWEEIEETLITGDVGASLAIDIVDRARKRHDLGPEDAVRAELSALLTVRDADHWEPSPAVDGGPAVVLVVGVNGTGKTTTIGKLAARERANGRRVVLAAADTFRAAAIDQLRIWAQRTDSEIVAHAPDADPAAVVFDALDAAVARRADIVIADTAGRLHTRSNLMDELAKVRRVIDKRLPGAAVETFFVLDATTGQNGLAQALAFHKAVGLTGVVLTKLDSTAKGGIVFAIEHELGVPVRFVGVGEQARRPAPVRPGGLRRRPVRLTRRATTSGSGLDLDHFVERAQATDGRRPQHRHRHDAAERGEEGGRPQPDRDGQRARGKGRDQLRQEQRHLDRRVDPAELALVDQGLLDGHHRRSRTPCDRHPRSAADPPGTPPPAGAPRPGRAA